VLVIWPLSSRVEVTAVSRPPQLSLGLGRSRGTVLRLSALFGVDTFGSAIVAQSFVALWLTSRFGVVRLPWALCSSRPTCSPPHHNSPKFALRPVSA
jgi:hypothetical protein